MTDLISAADTENGVGRSLKHLRDTQELMLVDTLLWMMLPQFPLIEETRWRHSFWEKRLSICTCCLGIPLLCHWINLFLTQKRILFPYKALLRGNDTSHLRRIHTNGSLYKLIEEPIF